MRYLNLKPSSVWLVVSDNNLRLPTSHLGLQVETLNQGPPRSRSLVAVAPQLACSSPGMAQMAKFSIESELQLETCDSRLQRLMREAIKYVDFKIVEGHRGKAAQEAAFAKGASKLHWPYGNHNATPSRAVDFAPFPVN